MERRDLEHLVDTYLLSAGLPPRGLEPTNFFVLPLTEGHRLGVQWQPSETVLFAHPGHARPWPRQAGAPMELDDDDDTDTNNEPLDLGVDEHGRWSLHIHGVTSLTTLCLRMSQPALGPEEFAAAVDGFRDWFEILAVAMDRPPSSTPTGSERPSGPYLGLGLEAFVRV